MIFSEIFTGWHNLTDIKLRRHDWLKSWKHKPNRNTRTAVLIGDMTTVKYELNYNCISQSIMRSWLQDVVWRTVAKCEQYIGLHATDWRQANWWYLFINECCTETFNLGFGFDASLVQKFQSLGDKFSSLGGICHPVIVLLRGALSTAVVCER